MVNLQKNLSRTMRYLVRDEIVMLGHWLAKEKISLRTIAHRLKRAYSTITDEVRKAGGDYVAEIAQKMTKENLKRRGKKRLTNNTWIC